jgi:hypothetical protein
MDHDRTVTLVVLADVLHLEPFGQAEVALHGGQLPQRPIASRKWKSTFGP